MTSLVSRISNAPRTWAELSAERPALGGLRPTWATVDLDRLVENFALLRRRVGDDVVVLPVVKADAYGHGAIEVARALAARGASRFAVALVEEGVELRRAGIAQPIQLLGALVNGQIPAALDANLTPAVHDLATLDALEAVGQRSSRRIPIHLKLDTGMGRIGFPLAAQAELLARLATVSGVEVEGVFTNFARADDPDDPETARQLTRLEEFVGRLVALGFDHGLIHASNSAAVLSFPAGWKNAVRPGLALYGIHPGRKVPRTELRPVLRLDSQVIQVKAVAPGACIGYGGDWTATAATRIATLPIGYDDGWDRRLAGKSAVHFDGGTAPVVGRISMDMTTVDVGSLAGVEAGAIATLIGERGEGRTGADELAAAIGTIPYELLCGLGRRVPRVYVAGDRIATVRSPFVGGAA